MHASNSCDRLLHLCVGRHVVRPLPQAVAPSKHLFLRTQTPSHSWIDNSYATILYVLQNALHRVLCHIAIVVVQLTPGKDAHHRVVRGHIVCKLLKRCRSTSWHPSFDTFALSEIMSSIKIPLRTISICLICYSSTFKTTKSVVQSFMRLAFSDMPMQLGAVGFIAVSTKMLDHFFWISNFLMLLMVMGFSTKGK